MRKRTRIPTVMYSITEALPMLFVVTEGINLKLRTLFFFFSKLRVFYTGSEEKKLVVLKLDLSER